MLWFAQGRESFAARCDEPELCAALFFHIHTTRTDESSALRALQILWLYLTLLSTTGQGRRTTLARRVDHGGDGLTDERG